MRGGLSPRGYTIVEVMIFLAISGVMFLMAASFVSGKQAKSEFREGMNDMNAQIQQVIGDVGNGFYPTNNNFSCYSDVTGSPVPYAPGSGPNPSGVQGTNQGCVFLGKIMQFQVADPSGTINPSAYNVYSIAGRQYAPNSTSNVPANFDQAQPIAVTSPIDITDQKIVEWGGQVTSMHDNISNSSIGAVGFFGSFGQQPGGDLQSGSQTTIAVAIPNVALGQTEAIAAASMSASGEGLAIDSLLASEPNPNITICFAGDASQYGSITIGGASGQRLSTSMQIGDQPSQVGC